MNKSVEQLKTIKDKILVAAENRALGYQMMYFLRSNADIFIKYVEKSGKNIFFFEYEDLKEYLLTYKQWLSSNYSESRRNNNIQVVRKILEAASQLEIMNSHTYHLIKLDDLFYIKTRPRKKQPVMSEDEFKTVVSRISNTKRLPIDAQYRYALTKALLYFLFYTGCRLQEALNVKKSDIKRLDESFDGMLEIEILGKGDKYRTVYANNLVATALAQYLQMRSDKDDKCDNLFAGRRRGRKYSRLYNPEATSLLNDAYDIAGLDYSGAHLLRRGYATLMLEQGATVQEIQELLGHSDIKTTMLYLDIKDYAKKNTYHKIMVARVLAQQKRETRN